MADYAGTPERAMIELLRDGWRKDEHGRWTHPSAPPGESIRNELVEGHPAKALEVAGRLVPSPRRIRG